MNSNLCKSVLSFKQVFGIFSEVQNGYSFDAAVEVSGRFLGDDPDHYAPVYSSVLRQFIVSSPWTVEQKSGMEDVRRRFNRGLPTREAREELRGLGLSPGTAGQVVRQWEDHMPGFNAEGFDGLGEERIVLRPNQVEKRRASMDARNAELESLRQAERLQGDLFASVKRKRSKYNGQLVNTFPEGLQGVAPVGSSADHPSIRYLVLCGMMAPEQRWLVASALSGGLDSRLYSVYEEASGGNVEPGVEDTGENGRVTLKIDTGSGVSTEADLGGSLDTGYVVESINDPLGIFPEGTEQGDFLDFGTVEVILKAVADQGVGYPGLYSSRRILSAADPDVHVELRLPSQDGTGDKFVNMDYSGGPTFTVTWGKFGSNEHKEEFPVADWKRYYRSQIKWGYKDVTNGNSGGGKVPEIAPRGVPVAEGAPPEIKLVRGDSYGTTTYDGVVDGVKVHISVYRGLVLPFQVTIAGLRDEGFLSLRAAKDAIPELVRRAKEKNMEKEQGPVNPSGGTSQPDLFSSRRLPLSSRFVIGRES